MQACGGGGNKRQLEKCQHCLWTLCIWSVGGEADANREAVGKTASSEKSLLQKKPCKCPPGTVEAGSKAP